MAVVQAGGLETHNAVGQRFYIRSTWLVVGTSSRHEVFPTTKRNPSSNTPCDVGVYAL